MVLFNNITFHLLTPKTMGCSQLYPPELYSHPHIHFLSAVLPSSQSRHLAERPVTESCIGSRPQAHCTVPAPKTSAPLAALYLTVGASTDARAEGLK